MALSDLKITNTDTQNKKISDIEGDTLIGTPADNKAKFDAYCELIKTRFNDLVDAINDGFVLSGGEYVINPSAIQDASSSHKGLMSAEDKAKLDQMRVQVAQVADGVLAPPTSGAVFYAIQRISGIAPNIADYIESYEREVYRPAHPIGRDYYWEIRKWHSGVCEVRLDSSSDIDTQGLIHRGAYKEVIGENWSYSSADNLYYANLERFMYPSGTFIEAPSEFVSLVENTDGINTWLVPRGAVSNANRRYGTQAYRLVRASNLDEETTHFISVYAIGRWR